MDGYSKDYTVDELMVATIARQLRDSDRVLNGAASPLIVTAIFLAKMTHSPNLVYVASSIGVDPQVSIIPRSTLDWDLWHSNACAYISNPDEFWPFFQRGVFNTMFHKGAQVDAYGNINGTVIGDYNLPKVRLSGGGGMADSGAMIERVIIWSTIHDKRTFVEKVDFVTCPGYLGGKDDRARLGLKGGPESVITNLAVMDFDEDTKRMRLQSLHPGVTLNQVVENTGFELIIPEHISETEPPTIQQVKLLRSKIDPLERRKLEF